MRMHPTVDFAQWTPDTGLDVLTWNMELGGGDILAFLAAEARLDCTGTRPIVRSGFRPFVLLLQEVWRRSDDLPFVEDGDDIPWTIDPDMGAEAPDVIEAAERCGLAYLFVPSARNGPDSGARPREDKGNAIFTSLSFNAPIALDLPFEGGRKVAVGVTTRGPGRERVRFVSTHLDVASSLLRTLATGNQTRARQALGLIDGVARAEDDGPNTQVAVVGGDFNTWAGNESALGYMREAFPQSPAWDGRGTRGAFPADHIFFRRRAYTQYEVEGYERIDEAYGSDHQGRRLTVTYRSGEPDPR